MFLNGHEVRHRAAELVPADFIAKPSDRDAKPHIAWLADQSGVPVGTIHNATRDNNPQGLSLDRVYALAAPLRREGETVRDVVAAIVLDDQPAEQPAEQPEGTPPPDRPRDPSAPPPRRNGKHDRRGPRRDQMRAAS